ncbi:MAG: hypothetical protein IKA91_02500, partial [Bacteroidaceae bacterium]|nr:hypothetical protein [Bacteroidaceae bacterium]
EELLALIQRLNEDEAVDGILCQLPLPKHLDEDLVINTILPEKDVDCFHPFNVGRMSIGAPVFLPCTPAGVMELLRAYDISVAGKECVVVGRSNIVGSMCTGQSTLGRSYRCWWYVVGRACPLWYGIGEPRCLQDGACPER